MIVEFSEYDPSTRQTQWTEKDPIIIPDICLFLNHFLLGHLTQITPPTQKCPLKKVNFGTATTY
jgi:hypothetical protein